MPKHPIDSDRLDQGEPMLLPWNVVRDMLERLIDKADEPVHQSIATADALYHLHRGRPLSARDAARRWGWGKTRAASHIADTSRTVGGHFADSWRTNNGDSGEESAESRTLRGQLADTSRTVGGQQRKVSPIPPSKEKHHHQHDAARGQFAESTVNPHIRPPTEDEIRGFAAIAGIDPELAIESAQGLNAVGWIDKHNRPYLDWRSPVKQGAQTLAKIRASEKAKEFRNGVAQPTPTASQQKPLSSHESRLQHGRSVVRTAAVEGFADSLGDD